MLDGCPGDYLGAPIGLFYDAFNQFQSGLKDAAPVPEGFPLLVREYINISTAVYRNEKQRHDQLGPVLTDLLQVDLIVMEVPQVKSSSISRVVTSSSSDQHAFQLIVELRNEIGTGNADPFVQAGRAYQKYWSSDQCTYISFNIV